MSDLNTCAYGCTEHYRGYHVQGVGYGYQYFDDEYTGDDDPRCGFNSTLDGARDDIDATIELWEDE